MLKHYATIECTTQMNVRRGTQKQWLLSCDSSSMNCSVQQWRKPSEFMPMILVGAYYIILDAKIERSILFQEITKHMRKMMKGGKKSKIQIQIKLHLWMRTLLQMKTILGWVQIRAERLQQGCNLFNDPRLENWCIEGLILSVLLPLMLMVAGKHSCDGVKARWWEWKNIWDNHQFKYCGMLCLMQRDTKYMWRMINVIN